jgi:hypothetical protein
MRRLFSRSGFSVSIARNDDQIVSLPVCPDSSKNAKFTICMGEDSGQYAGAPVRHASCLMVITCRSPQAAANGHQHSGSVLGCMNWGQHSRWLVTHDGAFFTPLSYPSMECIWRWGFMLIHFMAKSMLSLCSGPCPKKQFHSTNTFPTSPLLHVD